MLLAVRREEGKGRKSRGPQDTDPALSESELHVRSPRRMNSENNERKWVAGGAGGRDGSSFFAAVAFWNQVGHALTSLCLPSTSVVGHAAGEESRGRCAPREGGCETETENRDETLVAADHAPDCEVVRTIPTCISRGLRYTEIAEGR